MKITKEIEISFSKTKEGIICNNIDSLYYIWGSKVGVTDLRYKIPELTKVQGKYFIDNEALEERLKFIKNRCKNYSNAIKMIQDVKNEN